MPIIGTLFHAHRQLGFWAALEEEFPGAREQRCWVHKTANVLDKLPQSVQPYAKKMIHEMYLSSTKETALAAYARFLSEYEAKYPKATECLRKDEDVLFTFYDFPAEHWSLRIPSDSGQSFRGKPAT